MTEDDTITLLRAGCQAAGGAAAFARQLGVSRSLVTSVLRGDLPPRGKLLDAVGVERCDCYRRKSQVKDQP